MEYYTEEEINEIIAHVKKYTIHKQASNVRPALSLIFTLLGYFASIVLCHYSFVGILFIAFFSYRVLVIFHDCCHGCFFKSYLDGGMTLNNISVKLLDPFTLYSKTRRIIGHSRHHSNLGNIRSYDDTRTLISLSQYHSLSRFKKIIYQVLRSPVVFFSLSPLYVLWGEKIKCRDYIYIIKYIFLLIMVAYFGGVYSLLYFFLGQYLAVIIAVVIVHLQHQVNPGYWRVFDKTDRLSYYRAQLHGSSYLRVPFFLRWVTYGIEYHHIHHLSTQVPCYLLKRCQGEGAELFHKNPRVGYWQAFRSMFHTLFDEDQGRYISFSLARWLGLQA